MDRKSIIEARSRLDEFIEPLLPLFGRAERRHWGEFYVQGLLLEGRRKTAAGLASQYDGDKQSVQQFVNQSPWDHMPIRRELARRMARELVGRVAWIIDDTGFPKKGSHSVGVARQYSGTLGKVGNCQIGVSLNYATEDGAFPMDFELYLPKQWTDDPDRSARAGIPEAIMFKRNWEMALDMIDRAIGWDIPRGVVVADTAYGVVTELRSGLRSRGLQYVVGILGHTGMWDDPDVIEAIEQGRSAGKNTLKDVPAPKSALEVARLPDESWSDITWRNGSKGPMTSRFAAVRVLPSHGYGHGKRPNEPVEWLLIEWPEGEAEPTKFWISNLSAEASLEELVWWAKMRWHVEQNYEQLKQELGLDHFEGRSWLGWHHHITLTMTAFDFLLLEKLRGKKRWMDSTASTARTSAHAPSAPGFLPGMPQAHAR